MFSNTSNVLIQTQQPMCVASDDIRHRDVTAHNGPHKKVQSHPVSNGDNYCRNFPAISNEK